MGRFDSFLSNTISNFDKVSDFVKDEKKQLDKALATKKEEEDIKNKAKLEKKAEMDKYRHYIAPLLDIVEKDREMFKGYSDRNDTRNLCIYLLKENYIFVTTLGRALEKRKSGTFVPVNEGDRLVIPRKVFGFTENANNNRQIISNGIDALNKLLTRFPHIDGEFEIKISQLDNIVDKKHEYKDYCIYNSNSSSRQKDIIMANHYSKSKSPLDSLVIGATGLAAELTLKVGSIALNAAVNGVVAATTKNEGDHEYSIEISRKLID